MEETANLSTGALALIGGALAALGIAAIFIGIVWYILQVIANWKIFNKAGKPGWLSIIPVVNTWNLYDLSWSRTAAWVIVILTCAAGFLNQQPAEGQDPSTFAATLGSIVAIVIFVMTLIHLYKLAKAFGRGVGFFIGLVLLNPIFMLILGFGSDTYQGRQ